MYNKEKKRASGSRSNHAYNFPSAYQWMRKICRECWLDGFRKLWNISNATFSFYYFTLQITQTHKTVALSQGSQIISNGEDTSFNSPLLFLLPEKQQKTPIWASHCLQRSNQWNLTSTLRHCLIHNNDTTLE